MLRSKIKFLFIIPLLIFPSYVFAWGWQGHKLVGEIAWGYMTDNAREQAYQLLHSGRDTPGYNCDNGIFDADTPETAFTSSLSWADCARGDEFPQFNTYHADKFPACSGLGATACYTKHCASDVLVQSIRNLSDERLTESERRVALKMVLHLIGDLHQPVHVTTYQPIDMQVIPIGWNEPKSFHGYWDSEVALSVMADRQQLMNLAEANRITYQYGDVESWVLDTNNEGINISLKKLYDGQDMCAVISDEPVQITPTYETAATELGRRKIAQAGIRLAKILNEIFVQKFYSQTIQAEDYTAMNGVQTAPTLDTYGGDYVGWIHAGDWMEYDNKFKIPREGLYTISYRVASRGQGGVLSTELKASSAQLGEVVIPVTGSWENWTTVKHTVKLSSGPLDLHVNAVDGGWNINWIKIDSVDSFSQTIEAEHYTSMTGVDTTASKDFGGTDYVGWIDDGDWMAYDGNINVPFAGSYSVKYRVATPRSGGLLHADANAGSIFLGEVAVPVTGGWDSWTTVEQLVELPAGNVDLNIHAQVGRWNLNWIKIESDKSFAGNGIYRIINFSSGLSLDVSGVSADNGANILQWEYARGANQLWQVYDIGGAYRITAVHSGKALDVSEVSTQPGANIHQWEYVGGANQHWQIINVGGNRYRITALHSGQSLEVKDRSSFNGGNIQQWPYTGHVNQEWIFDKI